MTNGEPPMADAVKNGGLPAYPTQFNGGDLFGGLTKREAFALAALQGIVDFDHQGDGGTRSANTPDYIAGNAYRLADAMLKAGETGE